MTSRRDAIVRYKPIFLNRMLPVQTLTQINQSGLYIYWFILPAFPRCPETAHTYSRHSPRGRQDNHSDTSCIIPTLDGNHRPSDLFIDPVQMSQMHSYLKKTHLIIHVIASYCIVRSNKWMKVNNYIPVW